jgi:hypothetical protein
VLTRRIHVSSPFETMTGGSSALRGCGSGSTIPLVRGKLRYGSPQADRRRANNGRPREPKPGGANAQTFDLNVVRSPPHPHLCAYGRPRPHLAPPNRRGNVRSWRIPLKRLSSIPSDWEARSVFGEGLEGSLGRAWAAAIPGIMWPVLLHANSEAIRPGIPI